MERPAVNALPTRQAQREATRARLLQTAVQILIAHGVAGTTTLAVQQSAGVSRGALLHHFPTHAALLSATVAELVRMNEENAQREAARLAGHPDRLVRAIRTLASVTVQPSFAAELELWACARTDAPLREALRAAERAARPEHHRVVDALFAPLAHHPGAATVAALSVEFLRGLALSSLLKSDPARREQLIDDWIQSAAMLLDKPGRMT